MFKVVVILLAWITNSEANVRRNLSAVISEKVKQHIAKDGSHKKFQIVIDPFTSSLGDKSAHKIELVALNMSSSSNRFFAQFSVDGKPKLVTGHLNLPRKIAVLAHPLSAGEVIQESDIAYKEINSERVADSIISSKEELVGKTVKRGNLRANTPIRFNQVEKPTMVKRGDRVQIMFKTSSLVISNMGVAKEDGNLGQIIGFEVGNADDGKSSQKKMIHGRVIGPNQAEILKAS